MGQRRVVVVSGWRLERFGGLGVGWGWLDMRSGRQGTGLKTGHYVLNEFGARGG